MCHKPRGLSDTDSTASQWLHINVPSAIVQDHLRANRDDRNNKTAGVKATQGPGDTHHCNAEEGGFCCGMFTTSFTASGSSVQQM